MTAKTIKTTNYKHELIPYFQGRNSVLLVRWGPPCKG